MSANTNLTGRRRVHSHNTGHGRMISSLFQCERMVLVHTGRTFEFHQVIGFCFQGYIQYRMRIHDLSCHDVVDDRSLPDGEFFLTTTGPFLPSSSELFVQISHDNLVGTNPAVHVRRVDLEGVVDQCTDTIQHDSSKVNRHIEPFQHIYCDWIDHQIVEVVHRVDQCTTTIQRIKDLHIVVPVIHIIEVIFLRRNNQQTIEQQGVLIGVTIIDEITICKRNDTSDILVYIGSFLHELIFDLPLFQNCNQSTRISGRNRKDSGNPLRHDFGTSVNKFCTSGSIFELLFYRRRCFDCILDDKLTKLTLTVTNLIIDIIRRTRQVIIDRVL